MHPRISGIKCPSTLLAGRYRLTHGARAHTTIITRSVCGGWSPRSWFLTMVDKAKGDRVRSRGANRAVACKMHNIVKFHYRYNNAGLIRRAMRRLVEPRPLGIAQCPSPYDVPRDTRGSHIWNSLRYGGRKACVLRHYLFVLVIIGPACDRKFSWLHFFSINISYVACNDNYSYYIDLCREYISTYMYVIRLKRNYVYKLQSFCRILVESNILFDFGLKSVYVRSFLTSCDFVENHTEAETNLSAGRRTVGLSFRRTVSTRSSLARARNGEDTVAFQRRFIRRSVG